MTKQTSYVLGFPPQDEQLVLPTLHLDDSLLSLSPKIITNLCRSKTQTTLLTEEGQVYVFDNEEKGKNVPKEVNFSQKEKAAAIAVGLNHTCILTENGNVYTFGDNSLGQLGIDSKTCSVPKMVKKINKVTQICANGNRTVCLTEKGDIYFFGQQFSGNGKPIYSPKKVNCRDKKVKFFEISLGNNHLLARSHDGCVYSMGENNFGQLGSNITPGTDILIPILSLFGRKITKIGAGNGFSLVVTQFGGLYGFGNNSDGQLGLGHMDKVGHQPRYNKHFSSHQILNIHVGECHSIILLDTFDTYLIGKLHGKIYSSPFLVTSVSSFGFIRSIHTSQNYTIFVIDDKFRNLTYPKKERVELSVECGDLPNTDYLSLTDPMIAFFLSFKDDNHWIEMGRSSIQWNQLNPKFETTFNILKYQGVDCFLKFSVYDVNEPKADLKKHLLLGEAICTLRELLKWKSVIKNLNNANKGTITITVDEVEKSTIENLTNDNIQVECNATNLEKMDFFGKSDPYLVISRESNSKHKDFLRVFKTETIFKTLYPVWDKQYITFQKLCNGNKDCKLKIEVYDYDVMKDDDFILSFTTTYSEILEKKEFIFDKSSVEILFKTT